MIGRKAEAVLNRAVRYAMEQEHEYFTLEHVLWSLLADSQISDAIRACGGNISEIRQQLEVYLQNEVPKASRADPDLSGPQPPSGLSSPGGETGLPPSSSKLKSDFETGDFPKSRSASKASKPSLKDSKDHPHSNRPVESNGMEDLDGSGDFDGDDEENRGEKDKFEEYPVEHPVATLSIQRLIQRALFHVQSAGKDEIQPEDLLVALFQAKDSKALIVLLQQGIERLDVLNYISHGIRKDREDSLEDSMEEEGSSSSGGADDSEEISTPKAPTIKGASDEPLQSYTLNLNERARAGKVDPLIGRQNELERMIQTLCRRRKNNPLLVGEAGVGKTALAEGLALQITEKKVPDLLLNSVVYSLDLGALLAGAKFRGDFEQRFKRVLHALETKKERGLNPILFIDEIHTIIGAGAVSGGALDAANLLKPLLSQGTVRCIGSTTYSEFRNVFEKDHALARRFQKIDVVEPTIDEAIQILGGVKSRFEEHHGVHYTVDAIRAAVELSSKHLTDRFLPDKAIDVIDEAGAKARLKRDQHPQVGAQILDSLLIEEVVAQIARIPARSINHNQKSRLKSLKSDLQLTIYGQDPAIDALVTAIRLARAGLRTGDRPVGSFLFCGPTGVGKTELSKQLSHCLGVPFLRYDMSEYSEKHTVSRLIGAPPGYVGFDQAGLLTEAVLKNPHSVILLDEIEKAHSDIWNVLLQVMDHGALTDNSGRKADFRNAILIMTSNVGSRELERRPLGMGNQGLGSGGSSQKAVENTFSPEFRNRLDAIVYFNPLDPATVAQVVNKQLSELESQLLAKKVDVEFTSEVRSWLCEKGYDRLMGARPLARLIQDKIKRPLSEEILFGRLEHGGKVLVSMNQTGKPDGAEKEFSFEFTSRPSDTGSREAVVIQTQTVTPPSHFGSSGGTSEVRHRIKS